jgi:cell division septum initiation protein DivIVA
MGSDFFDGATFRTRLFGFDKEEVRACLQNLATDQLDAQRQIEQLTAALQAAESGLPRPVASGHPVQAVQTVQPLPHEAAPPSTHQVERLLASAQRVADDVRIEAEREAQQLLRRAQEEAAQLRSQAAADASALASTASARLASIETEIGQMLERRRAVQAVLERAADRLAEIATEMRQAAAPAEEPSEAEPSPRTATAV